MDGTGTAAGGLVKAAFTLAGGALNSGSTCGLVSGGCLGLAAALSARSAAGDEAPADVYEQLRGYTRWFEESFGSTLCSERLGGDLSSMLSFGGMKLAGRMMTRCMAHAGRAADHLVTLLGRPGVPLGTGEARGVCAGEVIRLAAGHQRSGLGGSAGAAVALDGGVGLSGGLCGALAALLMAVGDLSGTDPSRAGIAGTLGAAAQGVLPVRQGSRHNPFNAGRPLLGRFLREFGSLECREITGRTFERGRDLRAYVEGSSGCEVVLEWCLQECVALPQG